MRAMTTRWTTRYPWTWWKDRHHDSRQLTKQQIATFHVRNADNSNSHSYVDGVSWRTVLQHLSSDVQCTVYTRQSLHCNSKLYKYMAAVAARARVQCLFIYFMSNFISTKIEQFIIVCASSSSSSSPSMKSKYTVALALFAATMSHMLPVNCSNTRISFCFNENGSKWIVNVDRWQTIGVDSLRGSREPTTNNNQNNVSTLSLSTHFLLW